MHKFTFLSLLSLISFTSSLICSQRSSVNNRPVIGILAQGYQGSLKTGNYSYIAASYVKFIESGGGRVVPILPGKDVEYYRKLMRNINGILFPGGGTDLIKSPFAKAARILWDFAMISNRKRKYFPVWGTCLGFQLITVLGNEGNKLVDCSSEDKPKALNFVGGNSKLFQYLDHEVFKILREEEVTINYHRKCLTPFNFNNSQLIKDYRYMSTNKDDTGLIFISSIESKSMPVYGVQFHPEKPMFEYVLKEERMNCPHSFNAVIANQYFANFFVNETRKSFRCFSDEESERKSLIYNYKPDYTAISGTSSFEQVYFFPI